VLYDLNKMFSLIGLDDKYHVWWHEYIIHFINKVNSQQLIINNVYKFWRLFIIYWIWNISSLSAKLCYRKCEPVLFCIILFSLTYIKVVTLKFWEFNTFGSCLFTNVDHNRMKNTNPASPIWSWTTLFKKKIHTLSYINQKQK